MAYDNSNRWTLNKNERKEKETHPDYKGSIIVTEPGEYWLDGWIKDGANGKFISGTIKRKDAQTGGAPIGTHATAGDLDDDVPFASCDPTQERRVR